MEIVEKQDSLAQPPKTTKKQVIGVVIVAFCFLLVVIGLILVFLLNFNKTTPSQVEFLDNSGLIYCKAEANDNFYGYRFRFDDGNSQLEFDSEDSLILINDLKGIEIGKTYNVSVCYIGEIEGGNSEFSKPYTWLSYGYLDTPVATVKDNSVSWEAVSGADYYYVYYNSATINYVKCTQPEISFEDLPVGKCELTIVALSNKEYLKTSLNACKITVTVVHELKDFSSVSFNADTNILTIRGTEKLDLIEINVDGQSYFANEFGFQTIGGTYVYTIDISAISGNGSSIGVKPASDNQYISYSGDFLYI